MNTFEFEKVAELLRDFSTAMLITHDLQGAVRARPMAIAEVTPGGSVWFVTSHDSAKVHEIDRDTRASLVCQKDPGLYLALTGTASVVVDRKKVGDVWKEPYRIWFPDGPDDAAICLVVFEPSRAEYWDNQGVNKVAYLWQALRAYATGSTPQIKEGDQHGVIGT